MTEAEPGKLKASEFHLSWNNYEASLASFLRVLSEAKDGEEALYDVTISCSGGKLFQVILMSEMPPAPANNLLQAHRLVLATCSTYFRSLFVGRNVAGAGISGSGCMAHPIVFIPDLASEVMEHLLAFMYQGETTVTPEVLLPLIDAAKLLGIQGLMDPGNIRQLLEHSFEVDEGREERVDHGKLSRQEEDQVKPAKVNVDAVNGKSVEEIISQELKENIVKPPELAAPDSSNNSVFPRTVFPSLSAIPAPLALSLAATSQLALGLDLSHRLGFQPGRRRKSSPTNEAKSQSLSSLSNSGGISNMINSSSGNSSSPAPPHYPPTEDPSRPFGCTQCPKRFRMKHHLKEHMLIHSGEMPFSCHLCPKRFNRSYTLKNHMKLHSAGTIVDKFQSA